MLALKVVSPEGREPWEQTSSLYFVSQALFILHPLSFFSSPFIFSHVFWKGQPVVAMLMAPKGVCIPAWTRTFRKGSHVASLPPRSGGRETRSKKIEGLRVGPLLGCCVLRMSPFLVLRNSGSNPCLVPPLFLVSLTSVSRRQKAGGWRTGKPSCQAGSCPTHTCFHFSLVLAEQSSSSLRS